MQVSEIVEILDAPEKCDAWLRERGVENTERGRQNLGSIARQGLPLELIADLCRQLEEHLGAASDPGMALNNLDRFISASRSPLAFCSLLERDAAALPTLLTIFSASQYLSDLLVFDPESFDLLRLTEGQPVARDVLAAELLSEAEHLEDERSLMAALRRYKRRETLRIAYGDLVRGQRIDVVTAQISYLADAICETALAHARKIEEEKRGIPRLHHGEPARLSVIALGKLGGAELNYSSDIDLMLLYEGEGQTDGPRSISNQEFFQRVARRFTKLLTESTELGIAYRVDMRLRPSGNQGQLVVALEDALRYYDITGRTWERQAFVKARSCAGDRELGESFLSRLEPWIYRRYLNRADISGIKALKRRIEHRARTEEGDDRNVKTGPGGIRDIEFVIQFLQLLNGGDRPEIRTGNTLQAISRLEADGCLTMQEQSILSEQYAFLRKVEHRLQIMFDLQTHTLPTEDKELARLAIRLGYADAAGKTALASFKDDLKKAAELNRRILDHLLHDAFADEGVPDPEVDLVLDPDPSEETIAKVLSPHGFAELSGAYHNLMALAEEKIPFLSTRRCRHFLAAIAPRLLAEISATPDPDATLVNLSKVSDSLGGKGVLWELFSFSTATLQLYVRLCASSPYLSSILTSHPGMIDELMDSLVLQKLPTFGFLQETLTDLCRGAEDPTPILHSFKNSQHLRVGVRDILGRDDIRETNRALSDIAEVCLKTISKMEFDKLVQRFGTPMRKAAGGDVPCELIILALGKLGGREPNYHSDLDVVFLYEEEGETRHLHSHRNATTSNQHFFGQLAQKIIKFINQLGPYGRLYELDPRLRPTGRSGVLAVSLEEFSRYFSTGQGQLWERQALCKARTVYGSEEAREKTMHAVRAAITLEPFTEQDAAAIAAMRTRLEESASKENLKRGQGGTVDIEFAVQMLQLKHVRKHPAVLVPGTLDALAALQEAAAISTSHAEYFAASYRFLRSVEARIRLMNTTARHDLPQDPGELEKLAYLLRMESGESLRKQTEEYSQENRRLFEEIFGG